MFTSGDSTYFHDPVIVKANTSPVCLCVGTITPGSNFVRITHRPASTFTCSSWRWVPSPSATNGFSLSPRWSAFGISVIVMTGIVGALHRVGGRAQKAPGQGTGVLAVFHEHLTVDDRRVVPGRGLHVAARAVREVVHVLRLGKTHGVEVDHVDVGECSRA